MVNKKKKDEFGDDFVDDTPVDDPTTAVDESADIIKCPACNGTGSVPENLIAGQVDKWKNCPMCNGKGVGSAAAIAKNPLSCKDCNGTGKVVDTQVEGEPETYKACATCKGKGVVLV